MEKTRGPFRPEESPSPPPPPPPRGSERHRHADPRRFGFAIVCMNCGDMFATLQEARGHFLRNCPSGLLVDVLCGHCEMRTSSWPSMCEHLNKAGMQRQPACKPEYKMAPAARPEFRLAPQLRQSTASPAVTAVVGQVRVGQKAHRWRSPPELTLSPSREVARTSRREELSSALRHWARKHPGKMGLRGAGHGPAVIPLESTPPRGYRLASAAAGSARDLAPASPDPEEAYSPPAEEDTPWPDGRFLGYDPLVNRVSPLATPPLPSLPTESGEGAVGLAPAYVETYPLALPGSLVGEAGPPAVPPLFDEGRNTAGPAPVCAGTLPPAPAESQSRERAIRACDMIEEAATVACILREPDLADILQVPDLSLFSPSAPVPQVKQEPVEIIEVPDTPPRARPPPTEAPIDYRRAYEDLQQRMQGHMAQLHFWAQTVGELGQKHSREPTPQEQARRQQLIASGYWPPWMADVVEAPFSVLGENFRIYYRALLHEGGPRF